MNRNNSKKRKNGKVFSGKQKHFSRIEVRKINDRYQNKLVEFETKTDEELTKIYYKSKLSSTDKQAAYDVQQKRLVKKVEEVLEEPKVAEEVTND